MNKERAIEEAKKAALKAQTFYAVFPWSGAYEFGALRALNLTHPGLNFKDVEILVDPTGKVSTL